MQISEILSPSAVIAPLKSDNKEDIIRELITALPMDRTNISDDNVFNAVMERETITSTGIGDGIAIPHAKFDINEELVMSVGIADRDIDFSALDNKPVRIFFMLLSRKDVAGLHIRMLAKIARFLRHEKFKKELLLCKQPEDVLDIFKKEESAHFSK
jgi:PTS system nitrogen regulatory IIA component